MISVTGLKRLISGVAATALTFGLVTLAAAPANAAPAKAAPAARPAVTLTSFAVADDAATSDSTLSGLTVNGDSLTRLAPAFDPGTLYYEVDGGDVSPASVTPTVSGSGATAVVAIGSTAFPQTDGTATVPLTRGENDITVTVTSGDATSSTVYHVTVWRAAAPTSQIVAIADAHSSVYGGPFLTLTLTHAQRPEYCYRNYTIGGVEVDGDETDSFDPTTGLTKEQVYIPESTNRAPGLADLVLTNTCYLPYTATATAVTTDRGAVTYTAGYQITSADIPATVTSGTTIVLHGPNVAAYADVAYWLTDANGNREPVDWWDYTGNGTTTIYPDYPDESETEAWNLGSGPRVLNVGYCPINTNYYRVIASCTSVFSQTVNWVAPTPTNVSFSPSSGPVAGGTTIKLTGRFVLSGSNATTIKVGNQIVPSWTTVNDAEQWREGSTFESTVQGLDVITFPAPASATTGTVPITVTNDMGTTTARGTYTYSDQPVITSISPATVANSGGSVITVHGTAFGTSGTPTVIIDGVKSPSVTLVSTTELTAIVPASTDTGPVDVAVGSPQGGGISGAATLNLVPATTVPTVTTVAPTSGHVSDDVTLTGTGFGPSGTAGVSVGGDWALVTASSPTSITFEVPPTGRTGAQDIVVGATTGAATKAGGFTVLADNGIATVTPPTVPSYAVGNADRITLTGAGFGATGTVKVGAAAAVGYTATASGTVIAGVAVPTAAAGSVPIIVTPTHATTALRASVSVVAPTLSYAGSDPYQAAYGPGDIDTGESGFILNVPTTGGTAMRIQGTGFGTSGTVKLGTTTVATTSWTNTAITFIAPAHAAGSLAATVTPAGSTLSASQDPAVLYVTPAVGLPTIATIASVVDQSYPDRSDFDPVSDISNAFTLTGTNLAGTTASDTQLVITDGTDTFTVVPTAVTATSLTFAAPRGFTNGGWKSVQVVTNVGNGSVSLGLYYLNAGVQLTVSPNSGLCLNTSTPATSSVTYSPAVITVANTGELFGDAGAVTIGGETIPTTSYNAGQVVIDLANLPANLTPPWGGESIVVTPTDTSLASQSVGFDCAVGPSVVTTVNGSTADLTVPAGTPYTLGYTTSGIISASGFSASAPGGYEYVTAADYATNGFNANVQAGTPVAAGSYDIRVALSRATYASGDYTSFEPSPVHVTITGTPVTITPVSNDGASFVYKGQLGDGTNGSPTDFHYTASSTADAITAVTWQYRDSLCDTGDPSAAWTDGLPKDVSLQSTACGGDGTTQSSWDVRVATFAMSSSGTDRSIYYQASLPSTTVTITPRNVAVAAVRADKVYDGTTAAPLGDLTLTGAIDGDDVSLANAAGAGTFADATPAVNKPVTLGQPLVLGGGNATDYTLTNPSPAIVGTITKATAVLSLAASATSVLLSAGTPVTITPTVTDGLTNAPVDGTAAAVVLSSQTPSTCTITGTTMTAVAPGACVIAGTEAASADYTAATAASDPTSTTETITVQIFASGQALSVVADDLTVAVGDDINPTSEISGLFAGDSIDNVGYSYYSGATLLAGAPTDPGVYRVVPTGGTLTAANPAVYSNPNAFIYVAGRLTITALPPVIATIAPVSGPTTGGTPVTITGSLLDTVTSIRIGSVTLQAGEFTVNQSGTSLTFITPADATAGDVPLVLVDGTATAADVFDYTTPVRPPVTTPGAPTGLVAVGHDGTIGVAFRPPTSTGGAPITAYQVSTDGGHTWHTVATETGTDGTRTATVTGVADGTTYPVEVRAVNIMGAGPASPAADARPVAAVTTPGPPTHVITVGRNQKIGVTFTPPASDGGAPITGYQFSTNGGRSWHTVATRAGAGATRTATLAGVENGVTYRVKVRASNRTGPGPGSEAKKVLPNAAPLGTVRHPPASEVAIPAHPQLYHGPQEYTRALDTSHNGTWAHPINTLGARQLTVGEAATLSKSSLFGFNSAVLTAAGHAAVKSLAGHLRLAHAVSCEGYTDYAGEASHEMSLSAARALAVCQALVQDGAHVTFVTHGYGGARPVVIGGSAVSRAENRRVVVLVTR